MDFKKVLIVSKKNILRLPKKRRKSRNLFKNKVLKKYEEAHFEHLKSLNEVRHILRKYHLNFNTDYRVHPKNVNQYDLIITVGGDGTLLRASHFIKNQLVMGLNSVPHLSTGALLTMTVDELDLKIKNLKEGKIKIKKLSRLKIEINGKEQPVHALNDVLFANHSPAGTSRYVLKLPKSQEDQKSSGVWIATAAGSTGAILAAGGVKLSHADEKIQYVVREPYSGGKHRHQLIRGIFDKEKKIQLVNHTLEACLFVDGTHEIIPLKFGDKIQLSLDEKPLLMVV